MQNDFASINESKANFDDIYVQDDPRSYFSVLGSLDYMIPDVAEPIVRQILAAYIGRHRRRPVVLDVGCSYGINAAVHRFPLTFAALCGRYARHEMMAVSAEKLVELDRSFYAGWPDVGLARFVGLDSAGPAIRYATEVGLLDGGIAANLERDPLAEKDAAIARRANVILSTGAVGYVSERTYRKVLDAMDSPPWIVSFVLRMFPYDDFAAMFEDYGLVTEPLATATFAQRRFRDAAECRRSLNVLAERGMDTTGLESEGLFQADLFVSRPKEDVRVARLEDIVTITSGRNRTSGARYVPVETAGGTRIALEP
jgi:hypothetical protein